LIGGLSFSDNKLLKNVLEALDEMLKLDAIMGWGSSERSVAYIFEVEHGFDVFNGL